MKTNNNFHILIVDDEKFNIELASIYLLEEGYRVSFALNAQAAYETISKYKIDLILLDINMPQIDGYQVCESLKKDFKTKDIPIIFLTAQTDIEYISRAFEAGGIDYITKPFNGAELKIRVQTQLQNLSYLEEIKNKQSKLAQLSIVDPLTKLYNSLYFDSKIKAYQTNEEDFWFLFIKLNNFEKINKLYGLYGANKIIKHYSKVLEEAAPSNAIVAKLYGVSFGVLLKDYDVKVIKNMYEAIIMELAKDTNLSYLINSSMVFYNVHDHKASVQALYKKMQLSIETMDDTGDKYLFIN